MSWWPKIFLWMTRRSFNQVYWSKSLIVDGFQQLGSCLQAGRLGWSATIEKPAASTFSYLFIAYVDVTSCLVVLSTLLVLVVNSAYEAPLTPVIIPYSRNHATSDVAHKYIPEWLLIQSARAYSTDLVSRNTWRNSSLRPWGKTAQVSVSRWRLST